MDSTKDENEMKLRNRYWPVALYIVKDYQQSNSKICIQENIVNLEHSLFISNAWLKNIQFNNQICETENILMHAAC